MNGDSQPPAPKRLSLFGVIEFGFGGLILGLLAFALLLFTLNYFNIISISAVNNIFSYLPRKETASESLRSLIVARGAKDFPDFVKSTIKTNLSKESKADFVKDDKGQILDFNRLVLEWDDNMYSGFATIRYNDKLEIEDKSILLMLPDIIPNVSSYESIITSRYFNVKPEGKWECEELIVDDEGTKNTVCENFWTDESNVKKGIGVRTPIQNENKSEVFFCELNSGSSMYEWGTCSLDKAIAKGF